MDPQTPPAGNKNSLMIGLALLGIVAIVIIIFFFMRPQSASAPTDGDQESDVTNSQSEVTDEVMTEKSDEAMMEEGQAKVFDIEASNFKYSVPEIRVKQGDTVTINLTRKQGFHDLVIDEFNARTQQMNAGESDSVTFVADQAGTFEYYCSVGNHRQQGMVGTLVVE